jgi:7-carboxy-7-deazaguanine synthase
MEALVSHGFKILIETGGSESIKAVPSEVHIIMDFKCPASGMSARNHWANLDDLKPSDEIKFVIADRNDFDWAFHAIKEYSLDTRFHCLFSPAFGLVTPKQLVEWMLEVEVRARLNLQTHKYIWSPRAKGV